MATFWPSSAARTFQSHEPSLKDGGSWLVNCIIRGKFALGNEEQLCVRREDLYSAIKNMYTRLFPPNTTSVAEEPSLEDLPVCKHGATKDTTVRTLSKVQPVMSRFSITHLTNWVAGTHIHWFLFVKLVCFWKLLKTSTVDFMPLSIGTKRKLDCWDVHRTIHRVLTSSYHNGMANTLINVHKVTLWSPGKAICI